MMKIATTTLLALIVTSSHGFAPKSVSSSRRFVGGIQMTSTEEPSVTATSDFGSAMPAADDVYKRLGVSGEDKVAIGVDPSEVLQWLGTREDIIEKFLRDNKPFDRQRAEMEVDKFLLDKENVQAYIRFEKNKENLDLRAEAEQNLKDPSTWLTYALWIGGGISFGILRKNVIEPKFASGEWQEIHIGLPSIGGGGGDAATDAVTSAVTDAASSM